MNDSPSALPRLPEPLLRSAYGQHQLQRAPARIRAMAWSGAGASLTCFAFEAAYVLAGAHPRGMALAQVAALRLTWVLLLLPGLLLTRTVPTRLLALPALAVALAYTAVIDAGFYPQGLALTPLHALFLLMGVGLGMHLLPVDGRGRAAYLLLALAAHAALEARLGGGPLLPRAVFGLGVLGASLLLLAVLEAHFRSHRREFARRRETAAALEVLAQSREKVVSAGGSLATTAEGLTGSARSLWKQAEGLHKEVESIASTSERIAEAAGAVSQRAQTSAERAVEAQQRTGDIRRVVEGLRQGMSEVEGAVNRSELSVHRLQEHSTKALAFADILRDVAEQTHVLSVNASLEAARAGAHGLGFAVIAQEVRRLASVAGRSAAEVTDVVGRMSHQMDKVLEASGSISETAHRLTLVLAVARSTLEDIHGIVAQQQDDMGASTQDAGRQAQDTAGISAACARLRRLVEEHALTSADVAASIGELGSLSSDLRGMLPPQR